MFAACSRSAFRRSTSSSGGRICSAEVCSGSGGAPDGPAAASAALRSARLPGAAGAAAGAVVAGAAVAGRRWCPAPRPAWRRRPPWRAVCCRVVAAGLATASGVAAGLAVVAASSSRRRVHRRHRPDPGADPADSEGWDLYQSLQLRFRRLPCRPAGARQRNISGSEPTARPSWPGEVPPRDNAGFSSRLFRGRCRARRCRPSALGVLRPRGCSSRRILRAVPLPGHRC